MKELKIWIVTMELSEEPIDDNGTPRYYESGVLKSELERAILRNVDGIVKYKVEVKEEAE